MSVFFLILPLALTMAGVALFSFIRSTQVGQFDDLETPPWRVIFSDADESGKRVDRKG